MVNRFNWCGFEAAQSRKEKVISICDKHGWGYSCMLPGKRYVILVGQSTFYWTYEEVLKKGRVENVSNRLDNLSIGGNSLLDSGLDNKVSMVRRTGSI